MDRNDPQLREAVRRANEASRSAVSHINTLTASIRRSHDRFKVEAAERRTERADENRRGDNGPDAQRMQERIDRGETTWEEVRDGTDQHPSSIRVRQHIAANLDRLAATVDDDHEALEEQHRIDAKNEEIRRAMRGEE